MATSSGSTPHVINKQLIWSEELADFLSALDSYNPTIPTEVTHYYLCKSGVNPEDSRITKLTSLAVDKFIANTINEAKQISLLRGQALKSKSKRKVLEDTLDLPDLERSLGHERIHVKRRRIIAYSQPEAPATSNISATGTSAT
eukprot:gene5872-11862_t